MSLFGLCLFKHQCPSVPILFYCLKETTLSAMWKERNDSTFS